jgi:hypothetical protein
MAAPDSALPATGAQDVSPQTSIVLVTGAQEVPAGLELVAAGVSGPLPGIRPLGSGLTANGSANFWVLDSALQPSTDYVVRVADAAGTRELTHFSTAATYDKAAGTPAQISRLRLWRVRYPVSEIAAGGCVFSEFEGYFALDFTPGTVPGTPPEETVSALSLTPKTGGDSMHFVFAGITSLPGGLITATSPGVGVSLPDGESLSPAAALWKPELQPDREYCAAISTFGRNDRAAPPLSSNVVCAAVTSIDTTSGTGGTSGGAMGGTTGGTADNAGAAGSGGGCALGGSQPRGPAALLLALIAAVAALRRPRGADGSSRRARRPRPWPGRP